MKREYELTYILRIDANEDVMNDMLNEIKGWVEADGLGTVNRIDRWGRRRLAYEIDRQREGYYVLFDAEIDAANIDELERNLRLSTSVLRYLLIRKDENAAAPAKEEAAKETPAPAESAPAAEAPTAETPAAETPAEESPAGTEG